MTALVKPLTWVLGLVLVLVGIVGFFMDPIVFFDVNAAHNVVHLLSGAVALIAASNGHAASRMYLIVFGLVYAAVTVLGFMNVQMVVDLLEINAADNVLHLAIATACLAVGFGSRNV